MKVIYLIACTSRKQPGLMAAEDKYLASPWFRAARAMAEKHGDEFYMLSAKLGLLKPEDLVEDYNLSMRDLDAKARKVWAKRVIDELSLWIPTERCLIVLLAGKLYREHLIKWLLLMGHCTWSPMAHMPGLTVQQRWMEEQRNMMIFAVLEGKIMTSTDDGETFRTTSQGGNR